MDRSALFGADISVRYEAIRQKLDIRDLLEDLGLEDIDDRGDEVFALCPYHDDRSPSWSINVDDDSDRWGFHSCFVCRESGGKKGKGNVATLVRDLVGLDSYKDALTWLEGYVGIGGKPEDLYDVILETRLRTKMSPKGRVNKAPGRLYNSFKPVQPGDRYWKYLEGRGVLPDQIEARGTRIGRGGKNGRYNNRVVFPVRMGASITNFYARHIADGKPKGLYGPGKGTIATSLFGYEFADKMQDTAYLLEGAFDVLAVERALRLMDLPSMNVFATLGPILLEEQAKLLRFWKRIVAIPDMKGKAKSILPSCKNLLRDHELMVVELPKGTDADDHDDDDLAEYLENEHNARRSVVRVRVDYTIRNQ